MTMNPRTRWMAATATLLLAACGGGGGDDGPRPPGYDFDPQTAWFNFLSGTPPSVWTVSGYGSDGHAYSLRLGIAPVGNATYPVTNTPANRSDIGSVLREDGVVIGTGTTALYYDDGLQLYGSRDDFAIISPPSTSTTCDLAATYAAPPIAARLGTSGPLATTQILDGCASNSAVIGNATITWSLEWISGVPFFCVNFDESGNGSTTQEKDCIETDAAGNLGSRAYVALRSPGFAVDMFTP
jgi:hypothetical protein